MVVNGFCRSEDDNCVYHKKLSNGSFIYLLMYVNDMLIATNDMFEINRLKAQLSGEFEMKDLGAAKKIFGVEIQRPGRQQLLLFFFIFLPSFSSFYSLFFLFDLGINCLKGGRAV